MRTRLLLLAAAVALIAPATAHADDPGAVPEFVTLTGTVVSTDGGPLPHESLITVDLEDISRADAPAETIAETQIVIHGEPVSVPFTLPYSGSAVKPGSVYAVRAQIRSQGRLLFTTTERHQVDPLHPAPLELGVTRVAAATEGPGIPEVSLTDTYWKLLDVDGQQVQVADQMREPNLVLHSEQNRLAGSGGVNQLIGGYTMDGNGLIFSGIATTLMAGPPEAMKQEQLIVAALQRVTGFSIAGDTLTLTDAAGTPIIDAVAVALR